MACEYKKGEMHVMRCKVIGNCSVNRILMQQTKGEVRVKVKVNFGVNA